MASAAADSNGRDADVEVYFKTNLPPDKLREIVEALRAIHDPEIPINIYDLGLIREIWLHEDGNLTVRMTLTAVGCPVSSQLAYQVGVAIESLMPEAKNIDVEVEFDPPWTPLNMTKKGREMFRDMYGYDIVEQYQAQAQ